MERLLSILLMEQDSRMALSVDHRESITENGKIVLDDSAQELRDNADARAFCLGNAGVERNFKNQKSYRRRKRW
jgi:branched-chain amino acid transport system ATP-binding protein